MPALPTKQTTSPGSCSLLSFLPRPVMLDSTPTSFQNTQEKKKGRKEKNKTDSAVTSALLQAIFAFLKTSGFTQTLSALLSETHLEIEDRSDSPALDLKGIVGKYLEARLNDAEEKIEKAEGSKDIHEKPSLKKKERNSVSFVEEKMKDAAIVVEEINFGIEKQNTVEKKKKEKDGKKKVEKKSDKSQVDKLKLKDVDKVAEGTNGGIEERETGNNNKKKKDAKKKLKEKSDKSQTDEEKFKDADKVAEGKNGGIEERDAGEKKKKMDGKKKQAEKSEKFQTDEEKVKDAAGTIGGIEEREAGEKEKKKNVKKKKSDKSASDGISQADEDKFSSQVKADSQVKEKKKKKRKHEMIDSLDNQEGDLGKKEALNLLSNGKCLETEKNEIQIKDAEERKEPESNGSFKSGKSEKKNSTASKVANPFQRVKVDAVEFADSRLQDNSYWAKSGAEIGYGAKAQEVLGQVRGRDFRHEKTKKKRGSYRGGQIDFHSHSVKFQYSDDEE